MELEEVRTAFPAMTCLQFWKKQPMRTVEMLRQLRDLFGKPTIQSEDALRQASVRANGIVQAVAISDRREFLRSIEGRLTFDWRKDPANRRLLELVNKTNQFNLNGIRITEGEWMRYLADPASIVVNVSYEDKFGPLGIISVVAGRVAARHLEVSVWVMSCRAFSRRIEHHTLEQLFQSSELELISFLFQSTERNAPLQQFLRELGTAAEGDGKPILSRQAFLQGGHELPHRVVVREETPQADAPAVPG
jgi:FkbH-like protein